LPIPRLNRLKRPSTDTWPYQTEILFPQGLLGFEHYTRYKLIGYKHEIPFLRLEALENHKLTFYVIDPFLEHPNYTPTLTQIDLREVGVVYEAKLILLAIVNTNERPFVMNLAAPLLIHWSKRQGKQLLIHDEPDYPIEIFLDQS